MTDRRKIFTGNRIFEIFMVLVIIAAVFTVIRTRMIQEPVPATMQVEYRMEILFRDLDEHHINAIAVGDDLHDETSGANLGVITSIEVTPYRIEQIQEDHSIEIIEVKDKWEMVITTEGKGSFNAKTGLNVSGRQSYVGLSMKLHNQKLNLLGTVIGIDME